MPQVPAKLESDVALKRLTALATSWPESTFLSKLPAVFGRDVPVEAYRMLRKSLLDKKFSQPAVEIVAEGLPGHSVGYDNARRTILVGHQLVSTAEKDKEQAATLLIALIEEFGHHVDNVLRTDYSRRRGDGPRDEGAELAYALCKQWLTTPLPTSFATYSRPGQTRQLSTDANSLKNAIDRHLTAREREDDEKAGQDTLFTRRTSTTRPPMNGRGSSRQPGPGPRTTRQRSSFWRRAPSSNGSSRRPRSNRLAFSPSSTQLGIPTY
jgi:hypothetical protein